eukprot:747226-Hanusia_phi.AAC.3
MTAKMLCAMSVTPSKPVPVFTARFQVDPEVRQALRAVFHEILHKIDKYETTSSPKPSSSNSKVSDSASRSEARVDKAPKHISQVSSTSHLLFSLLARSLPYLLPFLCPSSRPSPLPVSSLPPFTPLSPF